MGFHTHTTHHLKYMSGTLIGIQLPYSNLGASEALDAETPKIAMVKNNRCLTHAGPSGLRANMHKHM